MSRFHRVAVLMGGVSSEREVSLKSGHAVTEGLRGAGYDVTPVVVDREGVDTLPAGVEAVFLTLHGGYGENGGVQADLDRLGMPYTGSGAQASRIAMDKVLTKRRLVAHGVPTPEYEVLGTAATGSRFQPPLVVKPPRDGSSVGVARALTAAEWETALATARRVDPEVLVERYIPGREWTVGILGETALPVVEVRPAQGWYGFDAKYVTGDTVYTFPEDPADTALIKRCQELALATFRAVGARGLGRVDFRISERGEPYVLELNSLPGFTATSLLPKAAARAGLGFSQLCATVIELARCDAA